MKRRFIMFLLMIGLLSGAGAVMAQPASAGPFDPQKVRVAPFSRTVKVSNGGWGFGLREKVEPGTFAHLAMVYSVYVPAHCVLQTNYMGDNHSYRNDRNKGKWVNGKILPIGKTTLRITCRG